MNKTAATLAALVLLVAGVALAMEGTPAHTGQVALNPADMVWGPAPAKLPPGAQLAVLQGDPGGEGPYVLRAKMPAGYKIPPHWHPTRENVTVLSGVLHVAMGEKFDESTGSRLTAGGYVSLPPLMAHYAWSEGVTEIQVTGDGPFALFYVNPADDPTAKAKP